MRTYNYMTLILFALTFLNLFSGCDKTDVAKPDPIMNTRVPLEGNSWTFINPGAPGQQVYDFSNDGWTYTSQVVRTYFRVSRTGTIDIGIMAKVSEGESLLKASFNGETKEFKVKSKVLSSVYIGTFTISEPGYYYLDIAGVRKQGQSFASITDVLLGGDATTGEVNYSDEDYFYWGRRGPSVHLSYTVPQEASDIVWFYNEVTVPTGNDVTGSYFMADGFGEGYFGFQVNSISERRILFSVWSPYQTDNPADIPEEYRVMLIRKGEATEIRDFGNEGSGGQSFMIFNWKAGTTYKFLLKVSPVPGETNKTDYTAYFYAPETGEWTLIASWRRPFTNTYAKSLHSFLENFDTRTGPLTRQAFYGNQWVYDTDNQWHELTSAKFTADATARDKARLDYAGGLNNDEKQFFLKNCGFFNENTLIDSYLTRKPSGVSPDINFALLPW